MQEKFKLIISENKIKFNDIAFDYQVGKILKIRMYVDVSVAEIFFDDGKASVAVSYTHLAFYHAVTAEKIVSKMEEFREKNIPIKWIMIDDGWGCISDRSQFQICLLYTSSCV